MKLEISAIDSLPQVLRDTERCVERGRRATVAGVKQTGSMAVKALRAMMNAAFKGQRIQYVWHEKFYENSGFDAAAFIYNKANKVIRAFSEGVVIKSSNGFFLAIPTVNAPKTGVGGKRISPSNFPEHVLGRLRFVYRGPGRPSLLVVDNLRASYSRKTGKLRGFRKATAKSIAAGKTATVVMFILVPQVTLKKRIDPTSVVKREGSKAPENILRNLKGR